MSKAVAITGTAGTVQTITGARTLWGISVREAAGSAAAATVAVRDATSGAVATVIVASLALAANGSRTIMFPKGIKLALGARTVITGQIEGSIYVD